MITALRWLFWLCAFGCLVWFTVEVPLGRRTLWGHLNAIAATPEARSLADGARQEAGRVTERVRAAMGGEGAAPDPAAASAAGPRVVSQPKEMLRDDDRDALRRVVQGRASASAATR